ncbi:MAG: 2,4-dihydroxyhept-2-ene-1,7-dioic acid aldolase [Rhodospirillales bacterium]|nr:2,4-dihydroxyhept-2-ene-1,7-dioic acid aldolase [Rhodospirillales bacterium]
MYRENTLKKKMLGGGKALGCWSALNSALSTEILAMAGFDFLLIDQEHGFGDPTQLAHQLQAMSATPTTSVVRVPSKDPNYAKRVLDAGAEAIMFPSVNTAAEARALVKACRYVPEGLRGMAQGMIRASNFGYNAADYVKTANQNLLVICQIETVEAVANIDELVAVEGVDMFFIGPNDLSASNATHGQYEDPSFVKLMDTVERAVMASDKLLATIPYGPHSWQDNFDKGYNMTTAGADVVLLRTACAQIVDQHHAKNGQ